MKSYDKECNKYDGISDEELIQKIKDGDNDSVEYMLNKYKPLVRSKAATMYILGADNEDLIQEGMIGLFKAIRDYDPGRDASFFTFADLCVLRQMYTAVSASGCKKHMPLNTYISLYSQDDNKNDNSLENNIQLATMQSNPESIIIDKENVEDLEALMNKELSSLERQVLDLYSTGMNSGTIAHVLGREEKSTDNALQRAKNKLKKIIRL